MLNLEVIMHNIAVIFGGKSVEHDVSILTGLSILKNIGAKYNVIPIYIDRKGEWYTGDCYQEAKTYQNNNKGKKCFLQINSPYLYIKNAFNNKKVKIDCAILGTHGGAGESGELAGLLDMCGIPFACPNVVGSSVCMDKNITKIFAKGMRVPVLNSVVLDTTLGEQNLVEKVNDLPLPVIVKPARCGSSIGVSRVNNYSQLDKAIRLAGQYDKKVLVEQCLTDAIEVSLAMFEFKGDIKYSTLEIVPKNNNPYDFDQKYMKERQINTQDVIPAKLINKIIAYSEKFYKNLGMNGVVRCDFFVKDTVVYLNEINTIPGNLAYYLFKKDGISYAKLLDCLIQSAIDIKNNQSSIITEFKSDILKNLDKIKKVVYK